jgi:hypothetical protein
VCNSPASPILADELHTYPPIPLSYHRPSPECQNERAILELARNEGSGVGCAMRSRVSGKRVHCTPDARTRHSRQPSAVSRQPSAVSQNYLRQIMRLLNPAGRQSLFLSLLILGTEHGNALILRRQLLYRVHKSRHMIRIHAGRNAVSQIEHMPTAVPEARQYRVHLLADSRR